VESVTVLLFLSQYRDISTAPYNEVKGKSGTDSLYRHHYFLTMAPAFSSSSVWLTSDIPEEVGWGSLK
jgi:hypothetical protein